jgi:ferric-dicitrate binding protein FerR (iron transport regulator)
MILALVLPALAWSAPPAWIANLAAQLEKRIAAADADMKRSGEIESKSQDLMIRSMKEGNDKAASIAQKAVNIAWEARRKAEFTKRRAQAKLGMLKRLVETWSDGPPRSARLYQTGKVEVQRAGQEGWNGLEESGSAMFQPGDRIRTGPDGKVEMRLLDDGSRVSVGPNSTVEVEAPNRLVATAGILQAGVAKILDPLQDRFSVRTPAAVCAVRGTQFSVRAGEDGQTEVIVTEGAVEVKNLSGAKTALVEAGRKITVSRDGELSEPVPFDPKTLDRWWED